MSDKNKLIGDSVKYTMGTLAAQFIGVATSILTRRYLDPDLMGIWAIFMLVLNYASFAHLGLFTAAEIRIPYLRGAGRENEAEGVRNTVFTWNAGVCLLMLPAAAVILLFFSGKLSPMYIWGIKIIPFIIIATLFYNLLIGLLRADKEFTLLAQVIIVNALLMLVGILTLVPGIKLYGMYWTVLFSSVASALFIMLRKKYGFGLNFNLKSAWDLAKIGIPLTLAGMLYTFLLSVDKLVIIKMLGPRELGYYSIAILVLTYANTLPKVISIVVIPRIQEKYGLRDSQEDILGYVKKPAELIAFIFPPMLAAAYFFMPVLVHLLMPKYAPGITSMRILLTGCFFISLVPFFHNFVIAINKKRMLIFATAVFIGIGLWVSWAAIKCGWGINGAAAGISLTYMLYFICFYVYVLKHCQGWGKRQSIAFLARLLFPFILASAAVLAVDRVLPDGSGLSVPVLKFLLFMLTYAPALYYIERKYHILKTLSCRSKEKACTQ